MASQYQGQSEPLFATTIKGEGFSRSNFSTISFFNDKILIKTSNGKLEKKITYDEILTCELGTRKQGTSHKVILPVVIITFRQDSNEDGKFIAMNLPGNDLTDHRDLYSWLMTKLGREADLKISTMPETKTTDGQLMGKPVYVSSIKWNPFAFGLCFIGLGIFVGSVLPFTAIGANYLVLFLEINAVWSPLYVLGLFLCFKALNKRIEFYDDSMKVFVTRGDPRNIPYTQLELGEIKPLIRNTIGLGIDFGSFKLSILGEGKQSSWNVVIDMIGKDGEKDYKMYGWLSSKIGKNEK